MKKFDLISKDFPHFLHGGDYNPEQWIKYPEILKRIFMLENYENGLRQGESLVFSADSTVLERMFYVDGLLNGERILYYPYGNVMFKYTYELGVLNGPYQYFFESGSIGEEGQFKEGKKDGQDTVQDRGPASDYYGELLRQWKSNSSGLSE